MSALMNLLRDWALPNPRKRRIDPAEERIERIPKLQRIGNFWNFRRFSSRPSAPVQLEKDHFLEVKQKRSSYNGILEDFLMDREKQMQNINSLVNDENDENQIASSSPPAASGRQNMRHFLSHVETNSFQSHYSAQNRPISKPVPKLVPITTSQSNCNTNYTSSVRQIRSQRAVPDLVSRNRAFGGMTSSEFQPRRSIMEYNNGIDSIKKYDTLLKSVIPELYSSSSAQRSGFSTSASTYKDHADEVNSTPSMFRSNAGFMSTPAESYGERKPAVSKKIYTIEISEDEDDSACNTSTATNKEEKSHFSSTHVNASVMVKPVNSLLEKTKRKTCYKDTVINEICRKYSEARKKNDQEIKEMNRTINELQLDTAKEEKLQQKRIDQSISSLLQTIVLDEDDEILNEFPPLTIEQRQMVAYAWRGGSRNDMLAQKFNLNITRADLQTLSGLNWLNDEVINYYMELIKERSAEEEHLPNTHVMNTFFIPKLMTSGHAGVRRWTRRVDIFSYDLIMVPVHVGNVHWCMAIINLRDKWIRYFDSMGSPNPQVLDALQNYLEEESMDKRKIPFDTSDWLIESVRDCPRQNNGSDCGVFSCMFAEFSSRDSKITFDQSRMEYFREKMVFEIMTGRLLL